MRNDNLKKFLLFHSDNPEEKAAYEMIDKVRYYQTAFITKLVNDFFNKHGMSSDSGYESIQKVVKGYLAGTLQEEKNHDSNSLNNNSASSNDALLLLAQMQSALMQQLNMQQMTMANMQQLHSPGFYNPMMTNMAPSTPNADSGIVQTDTANHNTESDPLPPVEKSIEPKEEHLDLPPRTSSVPYDDDDEDMDEDLTALAAGFQNMLQ